MANDTVELEGTGCKMAGCQKLRSMANPQEKISTTVVLKPGGSAADVEKFAKAHGLEVTSSDPDMHMVKLSGTTAQYDKAFKTELGQYKDAKGIQFRAYQGNLSVPKSLAGSVQGVLGLNNHPVAHPMNSGVKLQPKDIPASGFTGAQVGAAYNFPKGLDGTGQTISIIELGGGYKPEDLANYFQKIGIKEPQFNAISVDGGTNAPSDPNGADGEVLLDMEVAGSVAPGAKINVYFAPNTNQGFADAVAQAAKDTPKNNTESISWGAAEDDPNQWSASDVASFNQVAQDAAQKGVNIYVASGDNGSSDGESDGKNHVDFPSSSPWVISTGGTMLTTDGNGARSSETAWDGSGGGVSNIFGLPDFQQGAGVPAPTTAGQGGRGVPDVAGNASPDSGYDVIVDGQEAQIGGTSAVAPLYAGMTALLGQGAGGDIGYLNPIFYKNPGAFTDITSGSNGNFSAGAGWDPVTGLGVADGSKLLDAIKAAKAAQHSA
jgi:kumamolisin